MSKADKKQRHKAKREAKRRERRRQQSVSPIRRLADAPGEVECWMCGSLEDMGQESVFVFKRGAGMSGIAAFLIDRGVVGLKDAWTRVNTDRGEFEEMLEQSGADYRRVSVEQSRARIAGALRWAHEHGMRLPKDWDRAAAFLGGVGEWMNADTSAFVKEFAGHPMDLRQRLVGESFESFVQRKDIAILFSDDAPYEGDPNEGIFDDVELEWDDDDQTDDDEDSDSEGL